MHNRNRKKWITTVEFSEKAVEHSELNLCVRISTILIKILIDRDSLYWKSFIRERFVKYFVLCPN